MSGTTLAIIGVWIVNGASIILSSLAIVAIIVAVRRQEDKINNILANMSKLEDQLDQLQSYYEEAEQEAARTEGNLH